MTARTSSPRRKTTTKPAYHHGNLRRAVLDASLELISESGIGALSMREVARRIGATHAAPYSHFADRAAILAALATEGFTLLHAALTAAVEAQTEPLDRLQACGCAYFRFARAHPGRFQLMCRSELASPSTDSEVGAAALRAFTVLADLVLACQHAGVAPPGDPMPLVLTAWATAHGVATLWVDGPLRGSAFTFSADPEVLEEMVGRTLAGLFDAAGRNARPGPSVETALEKKRRDQ